jgi:glutaredoxin
MMFTLLKWLLTPVRLILGALILFYDRTFLPQAVSRDPARQALLENEAKGLVLYHFEACPFCVKVRRHIGRLGVPIEFRDVKRDKAFDKELVAGGGKFQVPCLRIEEGSPGNYRWLYESSDINEYLSQKFS